MNKLSKIIISSIAAVGIVGASVGAYIAASYTKERTFGETETYAVETKGAPLRVAIISDLQLPDTRDKNTHQYESFESTLTMLKNRGMDALIIGGDFTDCGTKNAWTTFKEIYDRVMADSTKPIPMYILGNHDYWLPDFVKCFEIPMPAKMQDRFTEYTGEPVYSHKVINGYHFICWSSSDGSYDKSYTNKEAVRAELDRAVAEDPEKPVFVITHVNAYDTAYGSDEWGNEDIYDVLKDYPQAVSISGHSHFSLIDERSIWQREFTALTTQSLDYIELESGKYNGSVPMDAYGNTLADKLPGCLYMTIEESRVTLERLEANTGNALKEPWVLEAPFNKPVQYTEERKKVNKAPVLDSNLTVKVSDITDVNDNAQKMISFAAGNDDDFVHSYKLQLLDENKALLEFEEMDYDNNVILYDSNGEKDSKNGKPKMISEVLYFSDYILGLANMSETAELRLPNNLPENAKYVVITAMDSWGAESNSVTCRLGE